MKPEKLLEILAVAGKLKTVTRHCYTAPDRKESVADHSWRIALMAMLLEEEFPEADMSRVMKMCLIHDLGEAFTGDIPTFHKTEADEALEDHLYGAWVATLPESMGEVFRSLLEEMEALETQEARIYKALDKLEAVISHNESDIATWLPLEYDLQLTYGAENVAFSGYFQSLKARINRDTLEKIAGEGKGRQSAAGSEQGGL